MTTVKRTTRKNIRKDTLEIKILKQGRHSKNVLSVSFFTSKDKYRDKEKYERYLVKFLYQKKQLKGFETRIYTDNSGKEFALRIAKDDPTVSVYYYNYPPLRDGMWHVGIFGAYIRFLPLFEPGLTTVWVSDIDIPSYYISPSILADAKRNRAEFCYRTFSCYEQVKLYGRSYSILAGTILSFHTFPIAMFHKFLKELVSPPPDLKLFFEKLNKENQLHGAKPNSAIPYGFDEVFTNKYMYDYLITHKIRCYIIKDFEYVTNILRWNNIITEDDDKVFYNYYKQRSLSTFKTAKDVMREKLPLVADKYLCVKDLLKHLDTFKTSFIKTYVKTGKQLDESLYPSIEA
jgi:hypothetical protein